VRYYIAAGATLAVGVTLGVLLARPDISAEAHDRLFIAHIGMNLLGWVGLTVIGTIALLWPTVLHTTKAATRGTLPLLLAGLVVLGLGCLFDLRLVAALGVLIYLIGLGRVLVEVVYHGHQSPAVSYAGWSIGAALAWFGLCTVGFGFFIGFAPTWASAADQLESLVPVFAVGFAAQILLGALSYLLPVVLGGGPKAVKTTAHELDRAGLFRVTVINVGLILSLLPMPSLVKVALWGLAIATLASFLALMMCAMRANRRVRRTQPAGGPAP
jgi:nitrite reductase (NO-forming)